MNANPMPAIAREGLTGDKDPGPLQLVLLYVAFKAGLIVAALLASQLIAFNWQLYEVNLVWPLENLPDLFRPFNTWDTQHYLLLSQRGYATNPMSDAFYPLYPMVIRLLTPVFLGHELIAAWVIANVTSLAIPVYMYKLCALFYSREQAFRATIVLLAFPTAFFLSAAYTEAIYLALCLPAFYYLFRGERWKASLLCFLLPLVRAQALLLILPIAVMFLQAALAKGDKGGWRYALSTYALPALATVLGVVAYLAFCRWQLGSFTAGFDAQRLFIANNSLGNLFALDQWFVRNFVDITFSTHGYTTSLVDRAFFVLSLPLLIGAVVTQNKALAVYALVTVLVPALAGNFMSFTRFLLLAFPLFIFIGTFRHGERVAAAMLPLQVLFYLMHTGGYWVA
jgi:hypothetical protein